MDEKSNNAIPDYPVRIWEVLFIILGALGLVGFALIGLGNKMLSNMFNPARAEAIANSLFDYKIPGGSQGVVGLNIGAEKFAIVNNRATPPDIVLFVSQSPIEQIHDETSVNLNDMLVLQELIQGEFTPTTSESIENTELCGKNVNISIQEGEQTFDNQPTPIPGVVYIAKITDDGIEKTVHLLTTGVNARDKAMKVFNSLQCR